MTDRAQLLRTYAVLLASILAACSTVPHEPNPAISRDDAKVVVRQALEQQLASFRPVGIQVDDDAIRLAFRRMERSGGPIALGGRVWYVDTERTFYYSRLQKPKLVDQKGVGDRRWQVRLSDNEGSVNYTVYFPSVEKGLVFLDAIERMRRQD